MAQTVSVDDAQNVLKAFMAGSRGSTHRAISACRRSARKIACSSETASSTRLAGRRSSPVPWVITSRATESGPWWKRVPASSKWSEPDSADRRETRASRSLRSRSATRMPATPRHLGGELGGSPAAPVNRPAPRSSTEIVAKPPRRTRRIFTTRSARAGFQSAVP